MIYQLLLEDTPHGVRVRVSQDYNDVTDNPSMSLAAMWMARFYTELEVAHGKGHAFMQEDKDGKRSIALH